VNDDCVRDMVRVLEGAEASLCGRGLDHGCYVEGRREGREMGIEEGRGGDDQRWSDRDGWMDGWMKDGTAIMSSRLRRLLFFFFFLKASEK